MNQATKQYQDIYQGYVIDYALDIPEPYYGHVLKNGIIVYKAMSYDAACDWIDAEKRKK